MPMYEFRCPACGAKVEEIIPLAEMPVDRIAAECSEGPGKQCGYDRVLSAVRTTYEFADFRGNRKVRKLTLT